MPELLQAQGIISRDVTPPKSRQKRHGPDDADPPNDVRQPGPSIGEAGPSKRPRNDSLSGAPRRASTAQEEDDEEDIELLMVCNFGHGVQLSCADILCRSGRARCN